MTGLYHKFACLVLTGLCLMPRAYGEDVPMDKYAVPVVTMSIPLNYRDINITSVGRLHYMGGVKITSPKRRFGGISSLLVSPDGKHILGLSDSDQWLVADIIYDGQGRLSDLENVRMAPLKKAQGKGKTTPTDAEAVTAVDGAGYVVSFESPHSLRYFQADRPGDFASLFSARAEEITFAPALPKDYAILSDNLGIEALTTLADGRMLAFSENTVETDGSISHTQGWLMGRGRIEPLRYEIAASYRPTDMATLPDGDILVLERHFSLARGMAARLVRLPALSIKPGRMVKGEIIADLAFPFNLDNMEALAVRKNKAGEVIIYIMSDNNYNPLQRNLLMMFRLDNRLAKKAVTQVNGFKRILAKGN